MAAPPDDTRHAAWLGERLRQVRQQQGMSLQGVEALSGGDLKASVVGAYERGERTISITRLERLADFYRVAVGEVLQGSPRAPEPTDEAADEAAEDDRVVIDLVALEEQAEQVPILRRYVASIRSRRGDYNGRVLTVRGSDLETVAAVMDTAPQRLRAQLSEAGLLR